MRVNRAYVDVPLAVGTRIALPESAAAHLLRVLRLGVGDGCVLFNGDGNDYDARIVAADKRGESSYIRAFSLHPGTIRSNLSRHLSKDALAGFGVALQDPHGYLPPGNSAAECGIFKAIEQGAATTVWCATNPKLKSYGGVYCEDVDIAVE